MQKKVTLSLDKEVYDKFQKVCTEQDIIVSKRVERLMREEIDLINKYKRGKR